MKNQLLPSDSELVSASQLGDTTAFGQLVTRYQSLVCSVAYNRCGDFAASEDCAQEAFLLAWKSLPSLRETSSFKSWICTIVRNLATKVKTHRTELSSTDSHLLYNCPEHNSAANEVDRNLLAAELGELVWTALKDIPENYREPLILYYREDKSVARVAVALGISEDAAKQRLARGRKMLHDHMVEKVENVLEITKPTSGFTSIVLSSVIGTGESMAGSSSAAATASAVSQTTTSFFWLPLANLPILAWMIRIALQETRSDKERDMVVRQLVLCTFGLIPMAAMMYGAILFPIWPRNSVLNGLTIPGIMVLYMVPVLWSSRILGKRIEKLREEENTATQPKDSILNAKTNAAPLIQFIGSALIVAAAPLLLLIASQQWTLAFLSCVTICLLAAIGFMLRGSTPVQSMRIYGVTLGTVSLCMIGIIWFNVATTTIWFAACIQASALSFAILQMIAWRRVYGR
jgi:RNA polymerase sigma factor (sigma-70 family)